MKQQLNQSQRAMDLVTFLMSHISQRGKPLVGYTNAAELIGFEGGTKQGQAMGQVTSRVDYACFVSGLPMLATNWVRNIEGEIHEDIYNLAAFKPFRAEAVQAAQHHEWSHDELMRVMTALDGLPQIDVKLLWREAADRELKQPGYIRYNLHRRVPHARVTV